MIQGKSGNRREIGKLIQGKSGKSGREIGKSSKKQGKSTSDTREIEDLNSVRGNRLKVIQGKSGGEISRDTRTIGEIGVN